MTWLKKFPAASRAPTGLPLRVAWATGALPATTWPLMSTGPSAGKELAGGGAWISTAGDGSAIPSGRTSPAARAKVSVALWLPDRQPMLLA